MTRYEVQKLKEHSVPKTKKIKGRLYITLSHGRTDPDDVLEGRGFDGPTWEIYNFSWVYDSNLIISVKGIAEKIFLEKYEDMIMFDEKYYGDFDIYIHK